MHLALYQPQIPGNTGTIGRMCVGLDTALHIIGPCAFDFSDKALRRAGLDYWPNLRWTLHADPAAFLAWLGDRQPWLVTKHGALRYDRPAYDREAVIILGNEVRGLPADWHRRWATRCVHLPIIGPVRSYNLANTAAVVLTHAVVASGMSDGYTPPALQME
ncbi:MAG: tRNA (cytidine(34)-2'-O)-methyltransferase [Planctomycetes bacterium]|nr:tRNA (cytidine(34)-2'-O)-methyltransferase [Planctomycetota bacterium]